MIKIDQWEGLKWSHVRDNARYGLMHSDIWHPDQGMYEKQHQTITNKSEGNGKNYLGDQKKG